ncbi:MAG TPA: HU family DNA-binding protein [bacterium]|nr:HU family DNA-binding protein [bacterium]
MNKQKLIHTIANKSSISKKQAENILDIFIDTIIENLKNGEKVSLTGFGQFEVIKTKSRSGVDPRNLSKIINIPEMLTPKFRAGKRFKDEIRK